MSTAAVLERMTALGVVLTADGDALEVDAPTDVLTDADWAALAAHKPRLLALLARSAQPGDAHPCALCGPAPVLDRLILHTAVCDHCLLTHGPERARALAELRRSDGNRAARCRYEDGRWRPIPTSEQLAAHIRRAAARRQEGADAG